MLRRVARYMGVDDDVINLAISQQMSPLSRHNLNFSVTAPFIGSSFIRLCFLVINCGK